MGTENIDGSIVLLHYTTWGLFILLVIANVEMCIEIKRSRARCGRKSERKSASVRPLERRLATQLTTYCPLMDHGKI